MKNAGYAVLAVAVAFNVLVIPVRIAEADYGWAAFHAACVLMGMYRMLDVDQS